MPWCMKKLMTLIQGLQLLVSANTVPRFLTGADWGCNPFWRSDNFLDTIVSRAATAAAAFYSAKSRQGLGLGGLASRGGPILSYLIATVNTQKRQRNLNQMTTKFFKIRMCRELSTQNVNFKQRIHNTIYQTQLLKQINHFIHIFGRTEYLCS